jgi:hypothetical protein
MITRKMAVAALAILISSPARAITIDFDSLATGNYGNELTVSGATFKSSSQIVIFNDGGNYICSSAQGVNCTEPLNISFGGPVTGFSFAAFGANKSTGFVRVNLSFGDGSDQTLDYSNFPITGNERIPIDLLTLTNIMGVRISSFDAGGFGFDTFTFSPYTPDPDPDPGTSPAPEPATWAMLIMGFALIGSAQRRDRAVGRHLRRQTILRTV